MSTFSWCLFEDRHDECIREYQRFLIDPRTNRVVWLDEFRKCECPKRGCECYVRKADRTKPKTKRKKK